MDLIEAKRLFFAYDGSYFYMTRDGVQEAYREAGVPPEVESAWLDELTQVKLQALRRKGNWSALYFLNRRDDHRHLAVVLEAEPMGVLWERCAFLEQLLKYGAGARRPASSHRWLPRRCGRWSSSPSGCAVGPDRRRRSIASRRS